MSNLWAIIYGFIQGISEFLPVSSSGHLALLPKFFDVSDPGVVFDLVMHLGTALAVIIYYHKEIKQLILELFEIVKSRSLARGFFFQNFALATIVSFILILIIKDFALMYGREGTFIGANLIFFGILMFLSDLKKEDDSISLVENKNYFRAIVIGASQSFAIFPGVSRSGITLTSARFMNLSRLEASRFSFLLSLPIILASVAYKVPEIASGVAINVDLSVILIGVISSFIFGIVTIHCFLKLISKMGLWIFTVYRIIIGLLVWYSL
jgi:undecaprenyl-diphosphatase